MARRLAYVGMAAGLCFLLIAGMSLTPGCYNVPQPDCGFFCGANGACPSDYACSLSDGRCHLNGAPAMTCPGHDAGPIDSPDAPIDTSIDGNVSPSVTGTVPANNATSVNVSAAITATFSEDVMGVSSGTFTLAQGVTAVPGAVAYASGTHIATFTPNGPLAATTTYTATLTAGISDLQGAPLTTTIWTFTTGADTAPPNVTMTVPAANATGVTVTAVVTAKFDEAVMGVSATTFKLANGATPLTGTVSYNAGTKTATIDPDAQFPGNTVITATLTSGITDLASNALAGAPVTWTFTTGADNVAPSVQSTVPMNGGTNVATSTTITVLFDEPVLNVDLTSFTVNDGAAVAGTLSTAMGGRQWIFAPTAALSAAATVTVTLTTAITDVAANSLAAPVTFTFMTQ